MINDDKAASHCTKGFLFRLDIAGMKNNLLLYVVLCLKALL